LHEALNFSEKLCETLEPLLRLIHTTLHPGAILQIPVKPAIARNLFDLLSMAVAVKRDEFMAALTPLLGQGRFDAEFLAHLFRNLVPLANYYFYLSIHPPPSASDTYALIFPSTRSRYCST
jgi:hypothetical protein